MKKLISVILLVIFVSAGGWLEVTAIGTDLVVTNTDDAGVGSLRYAIEQANRIPGSDTIVFAIPDGGPQTIDLKQELPAISDPLIIDALTQTGAHCDADDTELMIELNGQDAGERVNGLTIMGSNVVIRGLVINRFSRHGIEILSVYGENQIECNFIGTDITGTLVEGNQRSGISVNNSPYNTIGSVIPGMGNLISGNRRDGVAILGRNAIQNIVIGNLIGTDRTGTKALGNANVGLFIDKGSYNYVGGQDVQSRNIISGNGWEGIYINDAAAAYNIVTGNFIGTDVTGQSALGNTDSGVVISQSSYNLIGGTAPGAGNIISANGRQGVYIFAPTANENTVVGNFIGTDVTGKRPLGNVGSGVYLDRTLSNNIGGEETIHYNLIAANGEYGIYVFGLDWLDEWSDNNTFGVHLDIDPIMHNHLASVHVDSIDEAQDT